MKLEDNIHIGELTLKVDGSDSGYFLNYPVGGNDTIFKKLDIDKRDLQYKVLGYEDSRGTFPYCKTLEDLEKFTQAILAVAQGKTVPIHSESHILKEREDVSLGEYRYYVNQSKEGYYMSNCKYANEAVFTRYDINPQDLMLKTLGYSDAEGAFPYCKTLEDLTKFVNAIKSNISKSASVKMSEVKSVTVTLKPDYIIDISPDKINRDSKLNSFLLLNS
jgi:hypothetical protein